MEGSHWGCHGIQDLVFQVYGRVYQGIPDLKIMEGSHLGFHRIRDLDVWMDLTEDVTGFRI